MLRPSSCRLFAMATASLAISLAIWTCCSAVCPATNIMSSADLRTHFLRQCGQRNPDLHLPPPLFSQLLCHPSRKARNAFSKLSLSVSSSGKKRKPCRSVEYLPFSITLTSTGPVVTHWIGNMIWQVVYNRNQHFLAYITIGG